MRTTTASLVFLAGALALACSDPPRRIPEDDGGAGAGGQGGGAGGDGTGGAGGGGGVPDGGAPEKPTGHQCGAGATVGFKPEEFRDPVVHCHWGDDVNVMSTPMVVDLDGDKKPEIVFPGYDDLIHVLSGTDCKEEWSVPLGDPMSMEYSVSGSRISDLAIGDLDGDGKPEIASRDDKGRLFVHADGKLLAASDSGASVNPWGSISIANLDGKGPPEVLVGNVAYRYGAGKVTVAWVGAQNSVHHHVPAIADFDGDGVMEVVFDRWVLDGATGAMKLKLPSRGFAAVAEIVKDSAGPEIVMVNPYPKNPFMDDGYPGESLVVVAGTAAAEPGKVLLGPYKTGTDCPDPAPMGEWIGKCGGGPPAIGDFDGDGQPEIGVAGGVAYTVFDPECMQDTLPAECAAPGVLWLSHTQDASSQMTTSTTFDFNCDGKTEVIYRDECWLRVYDGATGTVRFATTMTSNTTYESVVVADTEGNGTARLVVSANDLSFCGEFGKPEEYTMTPFSGPKYGIYVLKDPMDRWVPTRPVWNENAYHITNVNDDGTIPEREMASWSMDNSYRANLSKAK